MFMPIAIKGGTICNIVQVIFFLMSKEGRVLLGGNLQGGSALSGKNQRHQFSVWFCLSVFIVKLRTLDDDVSVCSAKAERIDTDDEPPGFF